MYLSLDDMVINRPFEIFSRRRPLIARIYKNLAIKWLKSRDRLIGWVMGHLLTRIERQNSSIAGTPDIESRTYQRRFIRIFNRKQELIFCKSTRIDMAFQKWGYAGDHPCPIKICVKQLMLWPINIELRCRIKTHHSLVVIRLMPL